MISPFDNGDTNSILFSYWKNKSQHYPVGDKLATPEEYLSDGEITVSNLHAALIDLKDHACSHPDNEDFFVGVAVGIERALNWIEANFPEDMWLKTEARKVLDRDSLSNWATIFYQLRNVLSSLPSSALTGLPEEKKHSMMRTASKIALDHPRFSHCGIEYIFSALADYASPDDIQRFVDGSESSIAELKGQTSLPPTSAPWIRNGYFDMLRTSWQIHAHKLLCAIQLLGNQTRITKENNPEAYKFIHAKLREIELLASKMQIIQFPKPPVTISLAGAANTVFEKGHFDQLGMIQSHADRTGLLFDTVLGEINQAYFSIAINHWQIKLEPQPLELVIQSIIEALPGLFEGTDNTWLPKFAEDFVKKVVRQEIADYPKLLRLLNNFIAQVTKLANKHGLSVHLETIPAPNFLRRGLGLSMKPGNLIRAAWLGNSQRTMRLPAETGREYSQSTQGPKEPSIESYDAEIVEL